MIRLKKSDCSPARSRLPLRDPISSLDCTLHKEIYEIATRIKHHTVSFCGVARGGRQCRVIKICTRKCLQSKPEWVFIGHEAF